MTSRELFLSLKSYEEFDRQRGNFRELKMDDEVRKHMSFLFSGITPVNKAIHEDCLHKVNK